MIITGSIFFLLVVSSRNKTNILNNAFLQYVGKISFSIYLTQWWVIILLSKTEILATFNWLFVFLIYLALNLALSSITYYLVDKNLSDFVK